MLARGVKDRGGSAKGIYLVFGVELARRVKGVIREGAKGVALFIVLRFLYRSAKRSLRADEIALRANDLALCIVETLGDGALFFCVVLVCGL